MQGRRLSFLGYLNKNISSSRLLLRTLSSGLILTSPTILRLCSRLILTSPTILGLSSILGWVLHWPLLCLSWSLFSRLPWSDLYRSMGAEHCLYKLGTGSRRFWGTPMHISLCIGVPKNKRDPFPNRPVSHMVGVSFKEVLKNRF